MEDPVQFLVDRVNAKIASDASFRAELSGYERTVAVELEDRRISLILNEKGMHPTDPVPKADITVKTTGDVLERILTGKLDAMKAYTDGQLKVDAGLMDLFKARKLFSA